LLVICGAVVVAVENQQMLEELQEAVEVVLVYLLK
jgi:hypothetical protein